MHVVQLYLLRCLYALRVRLEREQGAPEPLSKLTLASLEDIGYVVDPGTVSTAPDGTFG